MIKYFLLLTFTITVYSNNLYITYTLSVKDASLHLFNVNIECKNINAGHVDFKLPVWRPGRYMIFDFSSGVIRFSASGTDSEKLKWEKTDKSTWHVETKNISTITVSYDVYADEFNLRTRGLDEKHGFIDGTSVFMFPDKYEDLPVRLKVIPYKDWHVTTGLENVNGSGYEFDAPNYEYFADCPLELGTQEDIEFRLNDKKYIISIYGNPSINKDSLINDFTKIIDREIEFWGTIPYNKYIFIIHCNPSGGGGTEHINSSVNDISAEVFSDPKRYERLLGLISHEFFHTWNVKQLRPRGLTPYDFMKENYTEELWISEGSTSYYDELILLRCGLIGTEKYLNDLCSSIKTDRNTAGNKIQSLAESSFDAWVKFWKNNYAIKNEFETNYYSKGADVTLLLDLSIRQNTENKKCLDDVFRSMYEKFPLGKGFTNEDFMKECSSISKMNFKYFFEDFVYGVKPLEWEKILMYAGLEPYKTIPETQQVVPGFGIDSVNGKIYLSDIDTNSLALKEGLQKGDELIAIDGNRMNFNEMKDKINTIKEGDILNLNIFRSDRLMEFTLSFKIQKEPEYKIRKVENPTELQKKIYESWLGAQW